MTSVVLILTAGIILLSISQVATVYFFLKYLRIVPVTKHKKRATLEDVNIYGHDPYVDISEVTPEDGINSLKRK